MLRRLACLSHRASRCSPRVEWPFFCSSSSLSGGLAMGAGHPKGEEIARGCGGIDGELKTPRTEPHEPAQYCTRCSRGPASCTALHARAIELHVLIVRTAELIRPCCPKDRECGEGSLQGTFFGGGCGGEEGWRCRGRHCWEVGRSVGDGVAGRCAGGGGGWLPVSVGSELQSGGGWTSTPSRKEPVVVEPWPPSASPKKKYH